MYMYIYIYTCCSIACSAVDGPAPQWPPSRNSSWLLCKRARVRASPWHKALSLPRAAIPMLVSVSLCCASSFLAWARLLGLALFSSLIKNNKKQKA